MFFDTVVLQAIARRFHRHADDALLDRCAAECGCSPIGRMCLLDDAALAEIVERIDLRDAKRVLDLGCGRGFFGRWLAANDFHAEYTGVDRVAEAVESARRHVLSGTIAQGDFDSIAMDRSFDAVVAFEVAMDGTVPEAALNAAAGALRPGGRFAVTIASLDSANEGRLADSRDAAEKYFHQVTIEDWTERIAPFAQRTYEWWVRATWHPDIKEKAAREARAALEAISGNRFQYAVLFARAQSVLRPGYPDCEVRTYRSLQRRDENPHTAHRRRNRLRGRHAIPTAREVADDLLDLRGKCVRSGRRLVKRIERIVRRRRRR
jgi:2-polyprenyl-3-methyl-5-hydroxy-6-metoxy-1,4-benzoquinol methylase